MKNRRFGNGLGEAPAFPPQQWENAYVGSDGSCKTLRLRMWWCYDRWWCNARNAEQGAL